MKRKTPIASRFWDKVTKSDSGCWVWTAAKNNAGYGIIDNKLAHRWAYADALGEIPAGLELDHLCRNPACVNPGHLEAVSHAENMRRAKWPNKEKQFCPKGHPYSGPNLFVNNLGRRECRKCKNERSGNARKIARKQRASGTQQSAV